MTGSGPLKVVGGRADQMFNDLTPSDIAKLPTYSGDLELTQHSAGSLTSQTEHKRWNHQNEKLAEAAEKADVTAMLLGSADYPTEKLDTAWNWCLTGQFHDMMAGTARPLAYTYLWNDDSLAMNYFSAALTGGVGAVTRALDTSGDGVPLVVYNPLSFARTDVAEATVYVPGSGRSIEVVGPDGKPVPSQVLPTGYELSASDSNHYHLLFLAKVPSVGYAVYHVKTRQPDGFPDVPDNHWASSNAAQTISNGALRVSVDKDGNVSSIYDNVHKTETLSAPIKLAFQAEAPSIYPAWNMDWKDQKKPPYAYVDGPAKISVVENGPVRYAIQVERDAQGSHFVQQVRLTKGSDHVEFLDNIDWKSTGCALKATFPLKASNPKATYNWQVGTVERGNNDPKKYEVASQRWFDLTDTSGDFGASVLTGAKYGSDKPDDSTLRLTLVYSPTATGGFEEQAYQDWGHHEILYGLYPHAKDWRYAGTAQEAMRLDQPLNVFQAPSHVGNLGRAFSALKVSDDDVTVVALKKAESSGRIVVRFREQNGAGRKGVTLSMPEGISGAREVDGQERPIGSATVSGGKLVFDMTPYAVRAFELQVKTKPTAPLAVSKPVELPYNLCATSTRANRSAGNFDGEGRSLAADQLPDSIAAEGVNFKIGPKADGVKNAVACEGQTIALPAGDWQKVYLLAASSKDDHLATFGVGGNNVTLKIQDWGGHIGEWDTRVWAKPQKEVIYDWGDNPYRGLEPGYMKMQPVAWCCDHKHDPQGDEIYEYSYLFKYSLPYGKTLTLPNDPSIKILALSVARNVNDDIQPADPLYDTLPRKMTGPVITPAAGDFKDSKLVTIEPSLFGATNQIKYSLDGSTPTMGYPGPIWVTKSTTIKARIGEGPVTTATLNVDDTTPPTLTASYYWPDLNVAELRFSEPIDKMAAEEPTNYHIGSATATAAHLSGDKQSVILELSPTSAPVDQVRATAIVRDESENHNEATLDFQITPAKAAYQLDHFTADGHEVTASPADLPVAPGAPWTINFFIRVDHQIPDHTIIAGFGQVDDRESGASRYLAMFDEGGLRFWGRNIDIPLNTKLDLNTWEMLTVTFDGTQVVAYKDGKAMSVAGVKFAEAPNEVHIAPLDGWMHRNRFDSGEIADFSIWNNCLDRTAINALLKKGHS